MACLLDEIILIPCSIGNHYILLNSSDSGFIVYYSLTSIIYSTYFIVSHSKYGHTVGKKIFKLKVVQSNNWYSLLETRRAFIRECPFLIFKTLAIFVYLFFINESEYMKFEIRDLIYSVLSFTIICWTLVEGITLILNKSNKAIHDFFGKSLVISVK